MNKVLTANEIQVVADLPAWLARISAQRVDRKVRKRGW